MPVDLSVLYTRKPEVVRAAFSLVPEYLRTPEDAVAPNLMDYGVSLGRRFRREPVGPAACAVSGVPAVA